MAAFRNLENDVERILFTKEEIDTMLDRLGKEISDYYRDSAEERKLILVGVLKGSFIFIADLIRKIDLPCQVLFLRASSYGSGSVSSGTVTVETLTNREELEGADILLVEDILDSGRTLEKLSNIFMNVGANSVRICTLLDKPARRAVPVHAEFIGYQVGDEFIVGYGLDYNEIYRNLPYIGILKREIYS